MKLEVDDMNVFENGIMEQMARETAKQVDNEMYDFLEKNGYNLERGNVEQIIELRDELAKEDKQVRAEARIVEQNFGEEYKIKSHGLIFFDSVSNPLTYDQVTEMILKSYKSEKNN